MNRSSRAFFLVFVTAAVFAQVPSPSTSPGQAASPTIPAEPNPPAQASNQFPAGTLIATELSKSLDARKARVGDRVEARTSMAVLSHGKVLIPNGAKIIGHVTEAKGRAKDAPNSSLGISFDRVLMKDGRDIPLRTTVQAIGRPLRSLLPGGYPTVDSQDVSPADMPSGPVGVTSRSANPYPPGTTPGSDNAAAHISTVAPLGPNSQGAVGMRWLSLSSSPEGSVVSSTTENVHLDSGMQLLLRAQ